MKRLSTVDGARSGAAPGRWSAEATAAAGGRGQGLQQRGDPQLCSGIWDEDHHPAQGERTAQGAVRSRELPSAQPGGAGGQSIQARRLATQYEKRAANYRAMWVIAAILL